MAIPVNDFSEKIHKMDKYNKGNSKGEMEKKEYVANSKRFTIDNNKIHLRIIGNCNQINMKSNSGYLDVVGNSTKVKVAENSGKINYTGNSGKVYLGESSQTKSFKYNGNNGTFRVVDKESLWKSGSSGSNDQKRK